MRMHYYTQPVTYIPQGFVDQLTHAVCTADGTPVAYAFSKRGAEDIAKAFSAGPNAAE